MFLNLKGRTFLEVMGQLSRGPAPPKYDLKGTWREYHFLNYGTFWLLPPLLFPFFYSSQITGLEYSFLPQKTEKEDFVKSQTGWIEKYLNKSNDTVSDQVKKSQ